jgi:hypothetical protein
MFNVVVVFLLIVFVFVHQGVVPALVNYNLRADPLLHSITVAKCRAIVFSSELAGVSHPLGHS